jgi:polyribonucleotide nucleotidyltransferase
MEVHTAELLVGGRVMTLETGRLAKQANGAVFVRYGDTAVLVTATASRLPREGIDFFPLTVDWEERLYAVGKIPGGFIKREGRPTEKAILAARLTDRPIRPLFPEGFRNDVQIVVTAMSVDHDASPEICGIIGASAALTISDIPFDGPIAAVEVGRVDGQLVINPTAAQQAVSELRLTVAGTYDNVLMIEAGAHELPEPVILDAIFLGHAEIRRIVEGIRGFQSRAGKPKGQYTLYLPSPELTARVEELAAEDLKAALRLPDKLEREARIEDINRRVTETALLEFPDQGKEIQAVLKHILKDEVRRAIIHDHIRPDGRGLKEIRPITVEVGVLPRVHGSGLFTRGQTQAMTAMTLGPLSDQQILDGIGLEESKRYIHHYNFPPFSTGETAPLRGPSRRSIGHGALAERALEPVIPPESQFPYALRLVSDILESNGSTSMASVCGSTLALMDGGVPIKAPVAGVAMGLVKEGDDYAILTDIQGIEDALGDMDFKVAGTRQGVTAIQMDIKIHGLERRILEQALEQAREGRLFILEKMLEVLPAPRTELSPYAPRIITLHIDPDKIRDVIGPGGKTINRIIESTRVGDKKVDIDIEDDGTIYIAAVNRAAGEQAVRMIEDLTRTVEVGQVFDGRVTRLVNFGAFVEVLPGKEGLVHISELAHGRVGRVEDVVKVGDPLRVKVVEIDHLGRVNLSHRAVLPPPPPGSEVAEAGAPPPRSTGERPEPRGGDRRDHGPRRNGPHPRDGRPPHRR